MPVGWPVTCPDRPTVGLSSTPRSHIECVWIQVDHALLSGCGPTTTEPRWGRRRARRYWLRSPGSTRSQRGSTKARGSGGGTNTANCCDLAAHIAIDGTAQAMQVLVERRDLLG